MKYVKFDQLSYQYLINVGATHILDAGPLSNFNYAFPIEENKEVHLLFPEAYYPSLLPDVYYRVVGDINPEERGMYPIKSKYINPFLNPEDNRIYYIVLFDGVIENIKSFKL